MSMNGRPLIHLFMIPISKQRFLQNEVVWKKFSIVFRQVADPVNSVHCCPVNVLTPLVREHEKQYN